MGLVMTAAPAVEAISVAEAKAYLRVDHEHEDALISSLIVTSRLQIEAALELALITQDWSMEIDAWPDSGIVELPVRPVQLIDAVKVVTGSSGLVTLDDDSYVLDGTSNPARLQSHSGRWPMPGVVAQGIEIAFTAGFGDSADDVPASIKQALLLLISHWYEQRDPVAIGTVAAQIPDSVSALLAPYRTVRI